MPQRVIDRIWDQVDIQGWLDCWPWKLSTGSHGYGQVGWSGPEGHGGTTAHRVAWMAAIGPIPDGMTVDHECRRSTCCNPLHLRLLPNVDNATDNGHGRKTECPAGHAYTEVNTYVDPRGHRRCRACARERRAA